jgi:hypothetical protein
MHVGRQQVALKLEAGTDDIVSDLPVLRTTCDGARYLVWIGGSILSSLSTFQNMWITR